MKVVLRALATLLWLFLNIHPDNPQNTPASDVSVHNLSQQARLLSRKLRIVLHMALFHSPWATAAVNRELLSITTLRLSRRGTGRRCSGKLAASNSVSDAGSSLKPQQDQQQTVTGIVASAPAAAAAAPAAPGLRAPIRRATPSDLPRLCMLEGLTAEGATWSDKQIEVSQTRPSPCPAEV